MFKMENREPGQNARKEGSLGKPVGFGRTLKPKKIIGMLYSPTTGIREFLMMWEGEICTLTFYNKTMKNHT